MAWTSVGVSGMLGSSVLSTLATITLNGQAGSGASVNDVLVYTISVPNVSAGADQDEGLVTSVDDSGGNTWVKAAEWSNTQGALSAGVCCSIWYSQTRTALTTSNTVSAHLEPARSRTGIIWRFRPGAGATIRTIATTWLSVDGGQPGSIDIALPSGGGQEYLRFRGIASETTLTTALTTTAGWTSIGTTREGANSGGSVRGEFIITAATTAASNPTFGSIDQASVYAVLEETGLMGQIIL